MDKKIDLTNRLRRVESLLDKTDNPTMIKKLFARARTLRAAISKA